MTGSVISPGLIRETPTANKRFPLNKQRLSNVDFKSKFGGSLAR
jgi:hypothetical protein